MRVAISTRVSTDDQVQGASLGVQQKACREYVAAQGWELIGVFEDDGVSGSKVDFEDRPAFSRLLAAKPEIVVVQDADRFSRNEYFWFKLLHFHPEIRFVSLDGKIDTADPSKRLTQSIHVAIGADEAKKITERTMRGRKARAAEGRWGGGPSPYCFRVDAEKRLQVYEPEARVIRLAASFLLDEGLTLGGTCRRLNALGHKTRGNGGQPARNWSTTLLRRLLRSRGLLGEHHWGDGFEIESEPILDLETWTRLQEVCDRSAKVKGAYRQGRKVGYMLSGHLISECGLPMTGQWFKKEGKAYYRCSGKYRHDGKANCDCRSIPAERVEALVRAKIGLGLLTKDNLDTLLAGFLDEAPDTDGLAEIESRLAFLERRMQRVLLLDDLDDDSLQAAVAELGAQKKQLSAQREAILKVKAKQEAREEVVDRLHQAAERALEELETPEGLRRAMNDFDITAGFHRAENGHRRLSIKGRVVVGSTASPRS